MSVVFEKPKSLTDMPLHYCPGCPHGIIHRLVAEAIDELGIEGKTIGVAPVGCSVMAYDYFACDMIEAAHGRAPATATGIKVGLIRPITLWPFPTEVLAKAADQVKGFISVELNMGQMIEDVRLATECKCPVTLCNRAGGMIPSPEQVLESIREAQKGV